MAIRRKRLRTSSWVRTTSIEPILKRRTTLEEFENMDPGESLSVVEAQFAKCLCIRSFNNSRLQDTTVAPGVQRMEVC